jgi:hypothetical protein
MKDPNSGIVICVNAEVAEALAYALDVIDVEIALDDESRHVPSWDWCDHYDLDCVNNYRRTIFDIIAAARRHEMFIDGHMQDA